MVGLILLLLVFRMKCYGKLLVLFNIGGMFENVMWCWFMFC